MGRFWGPDAKLGQTWRTFDLSCLNSDQFWPHSAKLDSSWGQNWSNARQSGPSLASGAQNRFKNAPASIFPSSGPSGGQQSSEQSSNFCSRRPLRGATTFLQVFAEVSDNGAGVFPGDTTLVPRSVRDFRIFGAEEARKCCSETRVGAPLLQDRVSSETAQGDRVSRRFGPLGTQRSRPLVRSRSGIRPTRSKLVPACPHDIKSLGLFGKLARGASATVVRRPAPRPPDPERPAARRCPAGRPANGLTPPDPRGGGHGMARQPAWRINQGTCGLLPSTAMRRPCATNSTLISTHFGLTSTGFRRAGALSVHPGRALPRQGGLRAARRLL